MYTVILYYNFQPISNPEEFCRDHKKKCMELDLLGRVYIAPEGINGTLAGLSERISAYKEFLNSHAGFQATEYKEDESERIPFRKLIVKTRPEMVTLRAPDPIDLSKEKGKRLTPQEWKETIESGEEFVMIDTRNDYEWEIGHFQGALLPELKNFYDFPQWISKAGIDKSKKILMYCTGGIRCEKFSVLMEKRGYKNVYQLHGGIINYGKKTNGEHFKGKCFVFDDRLAVSVNKKDKGPISKCSITGVPCDTYVNCANPDCNKLFICSKGGALKMEGCCSDRCMRSPRKRPLDPDNVFAPTYKWYDYFDQKI